MDKNGMITISSKDWSNYPVAEKTENLPEIILYWKRSAVSPSLVAHLLVLHKSSNVPFFDLVKITVSTHR